MKYNFVCAIATVVIGASAAPVADSFVRVQPYGSPLMHLDEPILPAKRDAVFVGQYDDPRKQGYYGRYKKPSMNERRMLVDIDQFRPWTSTKNTLGIGPQLSERSDSTRTTVNVNDLEKLGGNAAWGFGPGPQINERPGLRYNFGPEDVKRGLFGLPYFHDHFPQTFPEDKRDADADADPILLIPGMGLVNPIGCKSPMCQSLKQKREAEAKADAEAGI
ncbi:hypothetical protein BST61_g788 [Cercospora zeina]